MSREGALWIGGVSSKFNFNSVKSYQIFIFHSQLEGYMDEAFLKSALQQVGEYNVISIKVMKNKFTNEPASYGFINFDNDNHALTAMHKLNGKIIPSTNPVSYLLKLESFRKTKYNWCQFIFQPVRFKLNHQSTRLVPGEKDHSIWVGDLTPEVDDLQLFKFFADRFDSVRTAKGECFT